MITVKELEQLAEEAKAYPDALRQAAYMVKDIALMAKQNTQRAIDAEAELDRYRKGHQGACYACETVGEENRVLRAALRTIKKESSLSASWVRNNRINAIADAALERGK